MDLPSIISLAVSPIFTAQIIVAIENLPHPDLRAHRTATCNKGIIVQSVHLNENEKGRAYN